MRLTCLFLITFFPALSLADSGCRGFSGLLLDAYGTMEDTRSRMVLGLSDKQVAHARELEDAFFEEFEKDVETVGKAGAMISGGLDLYFAECEKNKELTAKLNDRILKDIRAVLKSDRRFAEWKCFFTQMKLIELEFDTLSALHGIELTAEKIEPLYKQYQSNSVSRYDSRFTSAVMSSFLIRNNHLTREQISKAKGEPFRGAICRLGGGRGPIFNPGAHQFWQDIPFQMLRNPRVQAELKLSPRKVQETDAFVREALAEMNVRKVDTKVHLLDAGAITQKDFDKEMADWRDKTKEMLKAHLTEEQFTRLWELFYQYNSRRMRLNWCRYLGGRDFDPEIRLGMEMNEMQTQTGYEWQGHQLSQGIKFLSGLVGEEKAKRVIGKIKLRASGGFIMDEPEKDKKMRELIERRFSGEKPRENPRRARRSPTETEAIDNEKK